MIPAWWPTPLLPASNCCLVSQWLGWSGMAAKVPKCQCMSLQSSSGVVRDPQLHLGGVPIPCTLDPVRFLGLNVHVRRTTSLSKNTILSKLDAMIKAVDKTSTTRQQKLLLYSRCTLCFFLLPHHILQSSITERTFLFFDSPDPLRSTLEK